MPGLGKGFRWCQKVTKSPLKLNNSLRSTVDSYRSLLTSLGSTQLPDKSVIPALETVGEADWNRNSECEGEGLQFYSQQAAQKARLPLSPDFKTNVCGICKKTHNQHLLAHCDTCRLHYHLSCLSPPLTRMPKKSKLYGWSCSECYPNSSSGEDAVVDDDEDTSDATRMRNRKREGWRGVKSSCCELKKFQWFRNGVAGLHLSKDCLGF